MPEPGRCEMCGERLLSDERDGAGLHASCEFDGLGSDQSLVVISRSLDDTFDHTVFSYFSHRWEVERADEPESTQGGG
jgi:hypothetical protein